MLCSPVGSVDRLPVSNPASVTIVDLMDLVRAPFSMAFQNANLAAKSATIDYIELEFDSVTPYFGIIQDSMA